MTKWLLRITLVLLIFVLALATQALRLTSQQPTPEDITRVTVDRDHAARRIAATLKIRTDSSTGSEQYFRQQSALMRNAWPSVYQQPSLVRLNDHSQLLGWRGAIDKKGSVAATMESASLLLAEGHRPQRSILIAFRHDEEVRGEQGAVAMSQYLADANIASVDGLR